MRSTCPLTFVVHPPPHMLLHKKGEGKKKQKKKPPTTTTKKTQKHSFVKWGLLIHLSVKTSCQGLWFQWLLKQAHQDVIKL